MHLLVDLSLIVIFDLYSTYVAIYTSDDIFAHKFKLLISNQDA